MALPQRPCCQGLELTSIIGGASGLIMNTLEPQIAQLLGGASSMANGYGAVSAGVSLISLGGWASLAGVGLCALVD